MVDIEISTETDSSRGWRFNVTLFTEGRKRDYDVSLSWSDYDHWSHGRVPPEQVVRAAFKFLLDREPADAILGQFDCAVIRRYFPEVDQKLPDYLGR
jgi:hypothetical protein